MKRRLALEGGVFNIRSRDLWKRKDMRLQTKMKLYNTAVVLVGLYWSMPGADLMVRVVGL